MALAHGLDLSNGGRASPSNTSISESERSFVSAESANNTLSSSRGEPRSTLSSSSQSYNASDDSSTSSNPALSTPLAKQNLAFSSAPRPNNASLASAPGSYFTLQPGSSGGEPRSPLNRRAPASRSSHGIETRSGPPPALSTQRSYNADSPWRKLPSSEHTSPTSQKPDSSRSIETIMNNDRRVKEASGGQSLRAFGTNRRSLDAMAAPPRDGLLYENDQDATIRVNGRHVQSNSLELRQHKRQEDLFLNLARADSTIEEPPDSTSMVNRRRSRDGEQQRLPRPSSSGRPNSSGGRFFNQLSSDTFERQPLQNHVPDSSRQHSALKILQADLNRDRPYAASAHPLDQRNRVRHPGLNSKMSFSSPQHDDSTSAVNGRRKSINSSHIKYNSSPVTLRPGSRREDEANLRTGPDDGTESTASTTAPSTVWDELDDLKARIRKIELTGNLPTTSNAAISSAYRERPATASTTMTTASISPKRRNRISTSPEAPVILENENGEANPPLQSALARARTSISPSLFRALETTATDALALAATTGGKNAPGMGSAQTITTPGDRQLRRKADNICRSLTEFCIALAEEKEGSGNGNRLFIEDSHSPSTLSAVPNETTKSSDVNKDPDLNASSRILSRLEARRTSLQNAGHSSPQSGPSSPRLELPMAASGAASRVSTIDRSNSVIRRRNDVTESKVNPKPLSRAATDAGTNRPSPHTRPSREYTSKHPLPTPPKDSRQSSPSARKTYFPISSQSPPSSARVSQRTPTGGSTSPFSNGDPMMEARKRRLASMGYGSSPSTAVSSRRSHVGVEHG